MALSNNQLLVKRFFDLSVSIILLTAAILPLVILVIGATISTRQWGLFLQKRIGYQGKTFTIFKIRSLKVNRTIPSNWFERALRSSKLDELPQLINVIIGDMSLVGPRPDIPGYADRLKGEDRIILSVKPGITGPATLKYKNEDEILALQEYPLRYNDQVIWPDKVRINRQYIQSWSFNNDLKYLIRTFFD